MSAISPGKVVVVTGAASGIGLAAAKRFAATGMRVCMVDLSPHLHAAAAEVGSEAAPFVADVADADAMSHLAHQIASRFGPVSLLMNNAAIDDRADALMGAASWRRTIDVNLLGVLNGIQAFVPGMISGGHEAIVINTGSKQGITHG